MITRRFKIDALFYLAVTIAISLVRHYPFFWDTIQLASKHAHFFYETGFQSLILPTEIDSGHPPAFGIYLAVIWKIFGKTLPVGHFAMLPFLWSIIYFLLKIGEKISSRTDAPWLVLLCFASPVLAGQSVLVSPDIVLVCFFLIAVWAAWEHRNGWLTLAVIGLGIVSMRGMMLAVGLYLFSLILPSERKVISPDFFKKMLPFLPGGLLAAGFLLFHWYQTGWIGYHESSTWAPSFERVDLRGFLKNITILGWRMLDFGQVFLWFCLVLVVLFQMKTRNWKSPPFRRSSIGWQLVILALVVTVTIVPPQLFHKGLLAHRYLLPVFLTVYFIFFRLIFNELGSLKVFRKYWRPLFYFILIGLLTGNFWIYPKKISQGWDSTLAHLPWYELQKQAENFIRQSGISYEKVGTAFPNIGPREIIELNGVGEGFVEKNLAANCYVLYSNIMNDFSDEEIAELENTWRPVFHAEKRGVCVILYKNSKPETCEN